MKSPKKLPGNWFLLLACLVAGLGLAGRILLPGPELEWQHFDLRPAPGIRLAAVAYWMPRKPSEAKPVSDIESAIGTDGAPTHEPHSMPGVVLCHGISCSKELMSTLGYDLARHGFFVLSFDFGAHGESSRHPVTEDDNTLDVLAAVEGLRRFPQVDPGRIVLVGHSMGAVAAAMAGGRDGTVAAVVCLGQKGPCSQDSPRNLLQGYGLYDQYHTTSSMLRAFSECATSNTLGLQTTRAPYSQEHFSVSGHRALLVMSDGDHASEVYSVRMIPRVRNWLLQAVGEMPSSAPSRSGWRVYADFLAGLGAYMAIAFGIAAIAGSLRRRLVACLPFAVVAICWLSDPPAGISEPMSLYLTLLYLAVTTGLYCGGRSEPGMRAAGTLRWFFGFALLAAAFSAGSILATVHSIAANPSATLPGLPAAFLNIIAHRCHFVLNILRADLFAAYTQGLRPSWIFLLLLGFEPIVPGLPCRPIGWLGRRLRDGAARLRPAVSLGARDKKAVMVLAVLVCAALGVGAIRYREGLLGGEAIIPAMIVMLRMYVIPFAVLIGLLRLFSRPSSHIGGLLRADLHGPQS